MDTAAKLHAIDLVPGRVYKFKFKGKAGETPYRLVSGGPGIRNGDYVFQRLGGKNDRITWAAATITRFIDCEVVEPVAVIDAKTTGDAFEVDRLKANDMGSELVNSVAVGVTGVTLARTTLLENLSTPDLKLYVKDRMAAGRAVASDLRDALRELKSRCKDEGVWHSTLIDCGIKPGTWRQWEFRDLNQLTTGKRTGRRKSAPNPAQTVAAKNLTEAKEQFGKAAAEGNEQAASIIASYEKELVQSVAGDVKQVSEDQVRVSPLAVPTDQIRCVCRDKANLDEDDYVPIPLPTLADRLGGIADELRVAYGLDLFADQIDAIAERVQDREELDKRMESVAERGRKSPNGISLRWTVMSVCRDRRFQEDMRLIKAGGGTTYRGKKIYGTDELFTRRFTQREITAELENDLENQLGVGPR